MQPNNLKNIFDSLKNNEVSNEKVASAMEGLSSEQKKTLDELMSDPELLKKFMASPNAQKILGKLKEK